MVNDFFYSAAIDQMVVSSLMSASSDSKCGFVSFSADFFAGSLPLSLAPSTGFSLFLPLSGSMICGGLGVSPGSNGSFMFLLSFFINIAFDLGFMQ